MWDPLLNDFPLSLHGLRCMLAIKYLHAVQEGYPPHSLGYLFLQELVRIVRCRDHAKAELRYGILKSDVISAEKTDFRQPPVPSCSCFTCPHHGQKKGMGQSPDESEAPLLSVVSHSGRPARL
nr:pre-coat protein [Rhynchosia yellow mosaic virus]